MKEKDIEAHAEPGHENDVDDAVADVKEIKLTLKDVNPIGPIIAVLRRLNNVVILLSSGGCIVLSVFLHD